MSYKDYEKEYERKYSSEYENHNYQKDSLSDNLGCDPEEKDEDVEEEEERRFGFELKMPVFERIVCKDPETKEQGEQINLLVIIFFIAMFSLPALSFIEEVFKKLNMFFGH